ncbi:hypothetical protein BGX23_003791 [Mortierella sp. AD031]|nr:hypothetical protein BGX23_003791 [Mortierella sp. AD031]
MDHQNPHNRSYCFAPAPNFSIMSESAKAIIHAYKATYPNTGPADPSVLRPKTTAFKDSTSITLDQVAERLAKFAMSQTEAATSAMDVVEDPTTESVIPSEYELKKKAIWTDTKTVLDTTTDSLKTGGHAGHRRQALGLDSDRRGNTRNKRKQNEDTDETRLVDERAHVGNDGEGPRDAETDIKPSRNRLVAKRRKLKLKFNGDQAGSSIAVVRPSKPKMDPSKPRMNPPKPRVDPSKPRVDPPKPRVDPYSVLPLEIWQEILSYMQPFQIAKASLVSKAWLEGARSHPIWMKICVNGKLGTPKLKYRNHMALACAHSYWVCERCFSQTRGYPQRSNVPLPVPIDEYGGDLWMLCLNCRNEYFWTHVEKPGRFNTLKTIRQPHSEMNQRDIYYLREHGGMVGLLARSQGIATTRRALFTARSRDTWDNRPYKSIQE